MNENIIETVCKQLTTKLVKFNAPIEDVEEIVKCASEKHSQSEAILKAWATRIYLRKHPDIAKRVNADWHYAN